MSKKPTILNRTLVHRSRLFTIEDMDIVFNNGDQRQYQRVKPSGGQGGVLIVPLIDNDTVLLIKEYSAGVDRYELGLPKGKIDRGETVLEAANRELKEEVGYGAKDFYPLLSLSLAPAYFSHEINVVIARDLYPEKLIGDEPEPLEIIPWKLSNISQLLATQQCTEARSIAALYMTIDYLHTQD